MSIAAQVLRRMFVRSSVSSSLLAPAVAVLALMAGSVCSLSAQTAPQLLPYTARVIAGGGSTAAATNSACGRTGTPGSGLTSYDAYADGCLATEISSTVLNAGVYGPRYAITDTTGAVYFGDWNNGLVRRIDPATGVVTAIAGGVTANPTGTSCSTKDPHTPNTGDLWGDGCLGTSVKFNYVAGLAFYKGDLYIADRYNYNVRKMSFSSGGVAAVILTNNGGTGYTAPPTVTFSAPAGGGTTATGTATINASGVVTGVAITNAGSGYSASAMPTVTFTASQGSITATGTAVYTGVMSMAVGDENGTSTASATEKGYLTAIAAGSSSLTITSCNTAASGTTTVAPFPCVLYEPFGIAFDTVGDLYIADYYTYAVLVANTNTTLTTTVTGISIPPQTMIKLAGSRASGGQCETGEASADGCSAGPYTSGTATTNALYNPYGVTLDTGGNIYIADEEYANVAEVAAGTGNITSYAGTPPPLSATSVAEPQTKRGPSGSFAIGSDFGLNMDANNNLYVTDGFAGYVWRVDASTKTMYVVAGGGPSPSTCTAPAGVLTDTYGDGCPALQANFSHLSTGTYSTYGVFGVYADITGDIFVGDEYNGLVREIASGTQFGDTGASATDTIDIHYPAGEAPPSPIPAGYFTVATTTPASSTVFTIGTVTCTLNADNNGSANTTDCLVPITATPTVTGPYTGMLTVTYPLTASTTATASFPLNGVFVGSPITRMAVTSTGLAGCTGTTYATVTPVTLTASLTATGPYPPNGSITFYTGPAGNLTQIGMTQTVGPLGTTTVYGATILYTFATAGTYTVTAVYTPTTGSYFMGSTNSTTLTSAVAAFTVTGLNPTQQASVQPGQTALYSFNLNQVVYTGTINYSCLQSSLPYGAACVFTPSNNPGIVGQGCSTGNLVALSITTTQPVAATPGSFAFGSGPWQAVSILSGLLLALAVGIRRRRIPMRYGQLWMVLGLLLAASGTLACNGKSLPIAGTPAGTYSVIVNITSTTGTTYTLPVPLTVL